MLALRLLLPPLASLLQLRPQLLALLLVSPAAAAAAGAADGGSEVLATNDCNDGQGQDDWPQAKKEACCVVKGIGCTENMAWLAPAGTTTTTAPLVKTGDIYGHECVLAGEDPDSWPEAKQRRCCAKEHVGCRYDCQAGLANSKKAWSDAKKAWCCKDDMFGCTAATTSAGSYDCHAELWNWWSRWSAPKKSWCCEHGYVTCGPETGDQRTGAVQKHVEPAMTSHEHDCSSGLSNWQEAWSAEKQAWCCSHRFLGCSTTVLPVSPHVVYDCRAGLKTWRRWWSKEKKESCCESDSVGCEKSAHAMSAAGTPRDSSTGTEAVSPASTILTPTPTTPLATTTTTTATATATTMATTTTMTTITTTTTAMKTATLAATTAGSLPATPLKITTATPATRTTDYHTYNCSAGLFDWKNRWSDGEIDWCCDHWEQTNTWPFHKKPFFCCQNDLANFYFRWPGPKKDWCCKHWQRTQYWPAAPREYCCLNSGSGCPPGVLPSAAPAERPAATTTRPFRCQVGLSNWEGGWSAAKQKWCCEHRKLGCPDPPTAIVTTRMPAMVVTTRMPAMAVTTRMPAMVVTTTTPYDCHMGLSRWRDAWDLDKQGWCCLRERLGCRATTTADPYYCQVGFANWERGWSDEKKEWCCKRRVTCHPKSLPTEVSKPYNCQAGSPKPSEETYGPFNCQLGLWAWRQEWSPAKKAWCCEKELRWCPKRYKRESGWSPAKRAWCCTHEGLCSDPTRVQGKSSRLGGLRRGAADAGRGGGLRLLTVALPLLVISVGLAAVGLAVSRVRSTTRRALGAARARDSGGADEPDLQPRRRRADAPGVPDEHGAELPLLVT